MELRTCTKCGETKSITDFYKHGDHYAGKCKECEKDYSKRYIKKYRDEHPGSRKEEHRKYHLTHQKERAESQRKRRLLNPDQMRAQSLPILILTGANFRSQPPAKYAERRVESKRITMIIQSR